MKISKIFILRKTTGIPLKILKPAELVMQLLTGETKEISVYFHSIFPLVKNLDVCLATLLIDTNPDVDLTKLIIHTNIDVCLIQTTQQV